MEDPKRRNETNLSNQESGSQRLDDVRSKLAGGRSYWRNFDEVLETEAYRKGVDDEFPERESLLKIDRRDFMKFVGAATVMGSLAGCRNLPVEKIVPYVKAPEEFVPGKPIYYATSFVHQGFAIGVLAESHMGRPTKLEGNPDHPASLGSTDAFAQAGVYGLYDPDRMQEVSRGKDIGTWESFFKEFRAAIGKNPAGFRILAEDTTSPSLIALLQRVESRFPGSKVVFYEPVGGENALEGARMAFGKPVSTVYDFSRAKVIVSLDSDFLSNLPGSVRYARDFASRRQPGPDMSRLYAIESYPTLVGAMADHRTSAKPSKVEEFARWLNGQIGSGGAAGAFNGVEWSSSLVQDLLANRGRSLVVAGEHQPAEVHALAHAVNAALGNVGSTVRYVAPMTAGDVPSSQAIRSLVEEMNGNQVSTLLILGGNPVYGAPADLGFGDALAKVGLSAHLSLHADETSAQCTYQLPANHFLESWGDARAYDGTVSLIQPLIAPLYAGKTAYETLDGLLGGARRTRDIVRDHWKSQASDDTTWESWLEKGFIPNTALPAASVSPGGQVPPSSEASPSGLETLFLPDPCIWDGRYANVPWLQELQKPFTSLTWDNTVQMSPRTAQARNLANHDVVELSLNGRTVQGPVWVVPGMADDTVVIHLGGGRQAGGVIAVGPGFDANQIRPSMFQSYVAGLEIKQVGRNFPLAATHGHHQTEGRDIVRTGTLADLQQNPSLAPEHAFDSRLDEERNLYNPEEFKWDGHQWGMTVDLNLCIGCNACVVACQAENNIPNVGKEQVIRQRELHWLRIDRYYKGGLDNPEEFVFQPMLCMHCEQAPCEPVCPVAATVHSKEGLNQMVYNRCVGTRYCSNNCPYKVRRFNYINYGDRHDYPSTEDKKRPAPTLKLLQNPDVSVRGRGVMEKCTYCVQRINKARIEAKKEGRPVRDGEIVTACQQACPTKVITFGDIADPNSAVSKKRADGRNYQLLEELNTKPRTTYLGKVRNPNTTG
jgi:molybdopterin-containing oxidoreductase family iron-sulfur binding subunit